LHIVKKNAVVYPLSSPVAGGQKGEVSFQKMRPNVSALNKLDAQRRTRLQQSSEIDTCEIGNKEKKKTKRKANLKETDNKAS
jgi:hypothetical protein